MNTYYVNIVSYKQTKCLIEVYGESAVATPWRESQRRRIKECCMLFAIEINRCKIMITVAGVIIVQRWGEVSDRPPRWTSPRVVCVRRWSTGPPSYCASEPSLIQALVSLEWRASSVSSQSRPGDTENCRAKTCDAIRVHLPYYNTAEGSNWIGSAGRMARLRVWKQGYPDLWSSPANAKLLV